MNINALIQFMLLLAIIALGYLVVDASQNMQVQTPQALQQLAYLETATTQTVTPAVASGDDLFPQMGASTVFDAIIKAITPTPAPTRATPTVAPPPDINRVLATEGWKLQAPLQGQAMFTATRKRENFTLKLGESRTIPFGRDQCAIELVEIDNKNFKVVLKYGDQTAELSMF